MHIFSRELLNEKKITGYKLAVETKIHPWRIYNYRDGKHMPNLPNARRIAEVLGLGLGELVFKAEGKFQRVEAEPKLGV